MTTITVIRSFRDRFEGGGGGGGGEVIVVIALFKLIPAVIRIDLWIKLSASREKRDYRIKGKASKRGISVMNRGILVLRFRVKHASKQRQQKIRL